MKIWAWDYSTNIDEAEAFQSMNLIRKLALTILTIFSLSCIFIIIAVNALSRIRRRNSTLQEVNSTRERVLSTVAHDLKNPLTSILLTKQLLLRNANSDSERKMLNTIEKSAENMQRLIDDLLTSAKAAAGTLKIEPKENSADVVISRAVDIFRPMAEEKHIALYSRVSEVLPKVICDEGGTISDSLKFDWQRFKVHTGERTYRRFRQPLW